MAAQSPQTADGMKYANKSAETKAEDVKAPDYAGVASTALPRVLKTVAVVALGSLGIIAGIAVVATVATAATAGVRWAGKLALAEKRTERVDTRVEGRGDRIETRVGGRNERVDTRQDGMTDRAEEVTKRVQERNDAAVASKVIKEARRACCTKTWWGTWVDCDADCMTKFYKRAGLTV